MNFLSQGRQQHPFYGEDFSNSNARQPPQMSAPQQQEQQQQPQRRSDHVYNQPPPPNFRGNTDINNSTLSEFSRAIYGSNVNNNNSINNEHANFYGQQQQPQTKTIADVLSSVHSRPQQQQQPYLRPAAAGLVGTAAGVPSDQQQILPPVAAFRGAAPPPPSSSFMPSSAAATTLGGNAYYYNNGGINNTNSNNNNSMNRGTIPALGANYMSSPAPGNNNASLLRNGAEQQQQMQQLAPLPAPSAAALAVPNLSESRLLMLGATPDESLIHVFTYIKNVFAADPSEANFDIWTLSAADAGGLMQRIESEMLRIIEAGRPKGVAPQFKYGTTYTQGIVTEALTLQQQQQNNNNLRAGSSAPASASQPRAQQDYADPRNNSSNQITLPNSSHPQQHHQPQPQRPPPTAPSSSLASPAAPLKYQQQQQHQQQQSCHDDETIGHVASVPVSVSSYQSGGDGNSNNNSNNNNNNAGIAPRLPPHLLKGAVGNAPNNNEQQSMLNNTAVSAHTRPPPAEPSPQKISAAAAGALNSSVPNSARRSNSTSNNNNTNMNIMHQQHSLPAEADKLNNSTPAAIISAAFPPMEPERTLKETMARLRTGAVLTKFAFNSDGKPQVRFFRLLNLPLALVEGAEPIPVPHLCWASDAVAQPATHLCLMDLEDVKLGARAPGIKGRFKRNERGEVVGERGQVLPDAMCITYKFSDREVNVCPGTDLDFDVWYYGMRQVLERNQKGNFTGKKKL